MIAKGWRTVAILAVFATAVTAGFHYSQGAGDGPATVQAAQADGEKQTITVSGSGEIKAAPDVAYANVGVQTRAATAEQAQADNAKTFSAVENVLHNDYKIDKKDVKTVNFNVHPEYKYADNEPPKVVGYVATHVVQVTYRDLDRVGELLDDISKAGANQVNNIRFGTEKYQQYELDAIKLAMANAKAKAQAIASTEGRSVKGVLNVMQQGTGGSPDYPIYLTAAKDEAMADAGYSTAVSGGEITVGTSVTVTYEF